MSFNVHEAFDPSKPKTTRWLLLRRGAKTDAHAARTAHLEVYVVLVVTGDKPVPQDYELYVKQDPTARWFLAPLVTEVSTTVTVKEVPVEFPI